LSSKGGTYQRISEIFLSSATSGLIMTHRFMRLSLRP